MIGPHLDYTADELRAFWQSCNDQRAWMIANGIPDTDPRIAGLRRLCIKVQSDLQIRMEQALFSIQPSDWRTVAEEVKV